MKYVLGIDFGGGASKATLLSEDGKITATAFKEYATYAVADGGREQKPDEWLGAALDNIQTVIGVSGIDAKDIVCVCFDAATHTAVLMDEKGKVLAPSVYWTDTRSVKEKQYLAENYGAEIFSKFKHEPDTIWTLTQLLWMKNKDPELFSRIHKITFAKDFVRGFFTGDFVTDDIEAEGSMLFDFDKKDWDEKFLSLLGLKKENFPKVVRPLSVVGRITRKAAEVSGLRAGTAVICGTTDTAAEIFAAGAAEKGAATLKLATAGRICVVTDRLIPDKHLINYSHVADGLFYPGTATKSCASSLRWFRDAFGGEYKDLDALAETVPVGSDGMFFHPFLSGELTPYGDPELKASFTGVTFTHTKAHFVRAVLEGVAFSLLDCKKYLEGKGVKSTRATAIGGGAKSGLWRQIVADALGIELISIRNGDSSFGSSMLAGIAAGFFKDFKDAIRKCLIITGKTSPNKENTAKYEELFSRYKKTARALIGIRND